MANFKINTIEDKPTATGKARKIADLVGAEGELLEKVTIWGGSPNFETLAAGQTIEGDYKDDGQYRTLYPARPKTPYKAGGGANIAKAQEVKGEMIKEAQGRKNDAIARAGAFRDATLVTLQMLKDQPFPTDADFKEIWKGWVKFFLGVADEPFV